MFKSVYIAKRERYTAVQVTMTLQRTLLAWITAIKSARELCPIVEGPLCCGENLQSTETATCNLLPSRHIMLLVVSTYRALSRCRALRPPVTVAHIQWISVSLKPLLQRRVRQIAGHTLSHMHINCRVCYCMCENEIPIPRGCCMQCAAKTSCRTDNGLLHCLQEFQIKLKITVQTANSADICIPEL